MGRQYEAGQLEIIPFEAYVERVIRFLLLVDPKIVIQRLAGRAPEEDTLFCNWNKSWWRIVEAIDEALEKRDAHQGDLWAKNASTGVMSRFR
jgi:radical SAM superfamily enzyme